MNFKFERTDIESSYNFKFGYTLKANVLWQARGDQCFRRSFCHLNPAPNIVLNLFCESDR
ncbi:hypothetical protein Fmac_023011 [Flemingia macrophylla]|uniref:Uncharacterized protein n=1 Tax=Flemingia macrophylla TaxID=520843 RepID=A0ABD1LK97_9FABA